MKDDIKIYTIRADQVRQRNVEFLWQGRFARRKLTLVAGDAGLGKSTLVLDFLARVSTGGPLPDGGMAPIGRSLIISAEDDADDTIVPRLDLAGANLENIEIFTHVTEYDQRKSLSLFSAHLDALKVTVHKIGHVSIVFFDPITAYYGGIDSHQTSHIRAIYGMLTDFAREANVCIIGLTHPNKSQQVKALHSFTGSYGQVAAARVALLTAQDPDDETRRLLLPVKSNISKRSRGIGFRLVEGISRGGILAIRADWDNEPVNYTADEVLKGDKQDDKANKLSVATEFLRMMLKDGPKLSVDVQLKATQVGISQITLRRAREALGVIVVNEINLFGGWVWRMPVTH